jgi:hypothetical protein
MAIGIGDSGFEVVADDKCWHTAEEGEKIGVNTDPVGEPLAWQASA